jgi:hypothetical protein
MSSQEGPPSETPSRGGGTELQVARIGLITALIVGFFGISGAVINAYNSRAGLVVPIQATQTAESRLFNSTTPPAERTPPESPSTAQSAVSTTQDVTPTSQPAVSTSTEPPSTIASVQVEETMPVVQLVRNLDQSNQEAVQSVAAGLLQIAKTLPLKFLDPFDSNESGWPEFQDTFEDGIQCNASIKEGQYSIELLSTSASGAAWCLTFVPSNVSEFLLSVETHLTNQSNSDVRIFYRYLDDSNFQYLILNPPLQTLTLGTFVEGEDRILVQSAFIPSIYKEGVNRISLLSMDDSEAIYINDRLEVLLTKTQSLGTGKLRIGLRLHEADQTEVLLIDNFELRGD